MPLDTSIPLQAGVGVTPPANPLAMMGQYQQLKNAMAQNALLGNANTQFQAQQAVGRAYQSATDLTTGAVDPSRAQAIIAADPSAAAAAEASATSGQALKGAQLGFNQAQQQAIASGIGGVLTQGDDQQNRAAYEQMVQQLASNGTIDPTHVQAALSNMPQAGSPPATFRQFGTKLLIGSMAGPQVAQAAFGTPAIPSNGQSLVPGVQKSAVMGGGFTPSGAPIQLQTGPETNAQLVPNWQLINGQYVQVNTPRGALPGASGVVLPAGSSAGSITPNGRYPAAVAAPSAAPQAPAGSVLAAPPPNTAATQANDTATFTQARNQMPADQSALQNLQLARTALSYGTSGKGTQQTTALYQYLQSAGLLPPGKTNDVANYEIFRKAAERNALALSANTDAGRALAADSNASPSISSPANMEILQYDIAKHRQNIAQTMTAPDQQTGIGYGAHAANFSSNTDPRGFVWDMTAPADQQKIRNAVKDDPAAQAKLARSIGIAQRLNLFNTPSLTPPMPGQVGPAPTAGQ